MCICSGVRAIAVNALTPDICLKASVAGRDQTLQLLSDPQLVEEIRFSDSALPVSGMLPTSTFVWTVDPSRLMTNAERYYNELVREGATTTEVTLTKATGHQLESCLFVSDSF